MNVVKCSNGHFFDMDTYQVCPHCGAPVGAVSQAPYQDMKEKKKGLFGKKTKETTAGRPIPPSPELYTGNMYVNPPHYPQNIGFGDGSTPTVDMPQDQNPQPAPAKKKEVTLDFWQTSSAQTQAENVKEEKQAPIEQPQENTEPVADEKIPENKPESLLDKVRNASATHEGKTMSYFSTVTGDTSTSKAKQEGVPAQIDPVVGWIVCIHGEHFGESFNIGAGMNSIGRSGSNRIILSRDGSVSREKHALITYEPKHRQFYVKPGDSSGLTYVNSEYITETKHIQAKDIIELGNSRFIFVPLCGEDFTWEDYMKG